MEFWEGKIKARTNTPPFKKFLPDPINLSMGKPLKGSKQIWKKFKKFGKIIL